MKIIDWLKGLKLIHYVIIVQSIIIIICFIGWVSKPGKQIIQEKVDYELINQRVEETVADLKEDLQFLNNKNYMILRRLDSIQEQLPRHRAKLDRIKKELNTLNHAYINSNYNDSTAAALLNRLSR